MKRFVTVTVVPRCRTFFIRYIHLLRQTSYRASCFACRHTQAALPVEIENGSFGRFWLCRRYDCNIRELAETAEAFASETESRDIEEPFIICEL